jgi:hypothetical protein
VRDEGDFNYDGKIDNLDVAILVGFYQGNAPAAPALTEEYGSGFAAADQGYAASHDVPEPTAISLLLVASAGLLRRRR